MQALESTNTLIIEFHDEESKATWLKELVQATYRASVSLLTYNSFFVFYLQVICEILIFFVFDNNYVMFL